MENWDDLRIFLTLARAESLSAAGRALRMDPATVGRRITRLETAQAQSLFARSSQGYALTDAGVRLLTHLEAAEPYLDAATADRVASRDGLAGQIRIGAPDGCATYLLPQVCAKITAQHPHLEVQIVSLPRVVNLSRREADMAITVSPPRTGRLTVQKISDYSLSLAASHHYLSQAPAIRSKADLRDHPIVGYIPDMIFDKELDYLSDLGVEHTTIASNSVGVQFQSLRRGAGVGVVHDFARPMAPDLARVLPGIRLQRTYYLVRQAGDLPGTRISRFAALLVSALREEIPKLERIS